MSRVIPSIFRFTQSTPAAVWTVVHNLGGNGSTGIPIVDCYVQNDGVPSKIIPAKVEMIDKHSVTITFSTARAGEALIIV